MVKNVNELMKGRGRRKSKRRPLPRKFAVGTKIHFGKNGQTYVKKPRGG